jgi:hypothetical protein
MKSRKTGSKKNVESSPGEGEPGEHQSEQLKRDVLQRHYYYYISACARAALRLAEVVQEVFQSRADVARMVRATMDQVVAGCSAVTSGKFLPTEGSLSLTEEVCQAAVSDTRKARVALRLFQEQVRSLDESYLRAKKSDPIAAFRALREVARDFSDSRNINSMEVDHSYGKRQSLWQYVLSAWDTLDPEAARIARWFPNKEAREGFKFDEASRTWRHVVSDESTAAEASVEVKSTFAVAK